MHIFNTLAPVFLLILLGAALRQGIRGRVFLTPEMISGINRLCYWVALPCLLAEKLATSPGLTGPGELGTASLETLGLVLGATGAIVLLSFLVARALKLRGGSAGTFMQATFRGNLAFVSLPVILLAFAGSGQSRIEAIAVLTLGPMVVVYNVLAVIVLLASQHRMGLGAVKTMLKKMSTNPLLLACAAGLTWSLASPIDLPEFLQRGLYIMGTAALPMALLCIGGVLISTPLRGHAGPAMIASFLKVAIAPAIGVALGQALGLPNDQIAIAAILLAAPTAISSYVLTDQLDGDGPLAASAIVISTLASVASLAAAVALTG